MTRLQQLWMPFEEAKHMTHKKSDSPDDFFQRQRALARWDNEGGAIRPAPQPDVASIHDRDPAQATIDTELLELSSKSLHGATESTASQDLDQMML
jgi:hypothetical protein